MNELRQRAEPLLAEPPHPPPSMDELRARVDRRRRRRARAVAGAWALVVVVVLASVVGALAVQDRDTVTVADGSSAAETLPPPAFVPGPVQMIVSPESAALDTPRTIEVRNTGTDRWSTCGFAVDLFRWTGGTWEPVASAALIQDPPVLSEYAPDAVYDCTPTFLAAGTTTALPFKPGSATWHASNGTIPPRTDALVEGRYELRDRERRPNGERPVLGRFEITAAAPTTTGSATRTTIDLFPDGVDAGLPENLGPPGGVEIGAGTPVLPTDVVVVDRDTIALAWKSQCNQPATEVDLVRTPGELELRLRIGSFFVIDCLGERDDWMVTFDLPFRVDDATRVVARADGGEVERRPGPIMGSQSGSWQLPDGAPTSFRPLVVDRTNEPGLSQLVTSLPWPLVDAGAACESAIMQIDGVTIPEVRVQLPTADAPVAPCSNESLTIEVADGTKVLGQP